MEISLSSDSITDDHITTKFGTCHDSPAVVPCAKFCSDHSISNGMRAKWNFHHIWIVMEKLLVKWTPDLLLIEPLGTNFREIGIELQYFFIHESAFEILCAKLSPFWLIYRAKQIENHRHILWCYLCVGECNYKILSFGSVYDICVLLGTQRWNTPIIFASQTLSAVYYWFPLR